MNRNITILLADDHPMLLKGLTTELVNYGYNVLSSVNNGSKALEDIILLKPKIAILDIEMPILNGFEVIERAKNQFNTKFIILTSHKNKGVIHKAKQLNVSGYLLKDEPFSEIDNCIKAVNSEQTYFSKTFETIFETEISPELKKINYLSPSERTIIRLVSSEKSSKEIGELLSISHRTVEKHRANIISKLDLIKGHDVLFQWTQEHLDLIKNI